MTMKPYFSNVVLGPVNELNSGLLVQLTAKTIY